MPQQAIDAPRVLANGETDTRWRLALLVSLAVGITGIAVSLAWKAMARDGITVIDWVTILLLSANIAWISLAASTAAAGAVLLALRPPAGPARREPLETSSRTVIIVPIRNEDMMRVTAAARAIIDSLGRHGAAQAFEFFFLSDTSDAAFVAEEEAAITRLRAIRPEAEIHYRRRANNHGRKAGNVADFVRRWGGRYDYMVVFDADSLMSGPALVELVRRMDASPNTALVQTVPMLVNAQTLIARSQQFAMRAYGQMFGMGLSWWSGGAGNFWGHNAIVRVRAFAAHAGLPVLPGRGPLGGHIMSHDFVEAAMLRRAGWRIEIAPEIEGTYEESPPTLDDICTRDHRWAQGNLQHLKLIGARGFDPVSRTHIVAGVMGYASALLWFSLILVGAMQAWLEQTGVKVSGAPDPSLLILTMVIVLSPKWLALLLWAAGRLPGWNNNPGFLAGLAIETAISAATAPVLMVSQAHAFIAPFLGRDAGWRPQSRVANGSANASLYRGQFVFGLFLCLTMLVSPGFAAWTLPVAASLVLAAPLASGLAHAPRRRTWLWRALATPEDIQPPSIVRAAGRTGHALAEGRKPAAIAVVLANDTVEGRAAA